MKFGSITTGIITDGLVFNMDAANKVSYPGTGNKTFNTIDTSISGTFNADAEFDSSTITPSFAFDGATDYINGTSQEIPNVSGSSAGTWSAWMKWSSSTGTGTGILTMAQPEGYAALDNQWFVASIYKWTSFHSIAFTFANGNAGSLDTSIKLGDYGTALTANVWYNATFVMDASESGVNRLKGYLNGIYRVNASSDTFGSNSPQIPRGNNIELGTYIHSSFNAYMIGNIDPCQIYNRALSASEVLHNYNALKGRFN
mgnify:CR=1 FL=1